VFVAGHSEGGIHATRLAQTVHVDGVIYLASASRTMVDTILAQLEAQLKNPAAMLSDKAIDQEMSGLRQAFKDFMAGKPVDPQKVSRIPQLQQLVVGLINPATATLTRALLGFDVAVEAPKLAGPFFVSAGGKDMQIDPERDAKRLEKALRDGGRDVTFQLAPDADHVLKHEPKSPDQLRADPVSVQNAYNADGRVLDRSLVDALVSWLAARSR
jgi:pimeloyl-ACP methyl ester carboxylesterase